MKTTLIALLALASTLSASGQYWLTKTNADFTNSIAASATISYTGTNRIDYTRHRTTILAATWSGSNTNTNAVTLNFVGSVDGSNYTLLPVLSIVATNWGTNVSTALTNLVDMPFGYLKAASVVNSATNSLTNFSILGWVREYPRN